MKIQCAVCNKDEASVYCSADEAALCSGCDHRVHHANKLAGKHSRFSLIHPSPKESPLCDICQEKRAFLFCQQDRAILCRDCDIPIHKVNEHTQKHNRFLLTGVKLSASSSLYSPPSPSATANSTDSALAAASDLVPDHRQNKPGVITKSQKPQRSPPAAATPPPPPVAAIFDSNQTPPINKSLGSNTNPSSGQNGNQAVNGSGHGSTTTASSISEYLIETLPGWHVEDFLDSSPLFLKGGDMDVMPFWDGDLLVEGNMNTWSPETMGMWVPQAPLPSLPLVPPPPPSSNYMGGSYDGGGGQLGPKELLVFGTKPNNNIKSSRKWRPDDGNCFTVPQISPPSSTASKRSRKFWH